MKQTTRHGLEGKEETIFLVSSSEGKAGMLGIYAETGQQVRGGGGGGGGSVHSKTNTANKRFCV